MPSTLRADRHVDAPPPARPIGEVFDREGIYEDGRPVATPRARRVSVRTVAADVLLIAAVLLVMAAGDLLFGEVADGVEHFTIGPAEVTALLDQLEASKASLQRITGERDSACDLVTCHREAWQRLRQAVERVIPGFVAKPGEHAAEQAVRALEELDRLRGVTKAELRDVKRRLRERYDEASDLGRVVSCDWGKRPTREDPIAVTVSRTVNSQVRVNTYVLEERAAHGVHVGSTETREIAETEEGAASKVLSEIGRTEAILFTLGFDPQTLKAVVEIDFGGSQERFRGLLYVDGKLSTAGPHRESFKLAGCDAYELAESWAKSHDDEADGEQSREPAPGPVVGDPHPPRTATNLGASIEIEPGSPDRIEQVYALLSEIGERLGRLEARLVG
eukprot:g14910.t1